MWRFGSGKVLNWLKVALDMKVNVELRMKYVCCVVAVQLEEERQVTARLSKSLELERRKLESWEQKAKVSVDRSTSGGGGS